MAWYTFPPQSAIGVDGQPIREGTGQVYALGDASGSTPLAIRNPVTEIAMSSVEISSVGASAAFQSERPVVYWRSADGAAILLVSVDGLLEQATAAAVAAQSIRDSLPVLIESAIENYLGAGGTEGLTPEQVQDIVDSMIIAGTGVAKAYDDALNQLTLSVSGDVGGGLNTDELSAWIDTSISSGAIKAALDGKANGVHGHTVGDIDGLDAALTALETAPITYESLPAGTMLSTTSSTERPTARADLHVTFRTATDPSAAMLTGDHWAKKVTP